MRLLDPPHYCDMQKRRGVIEMESAKQGRKRGRKWGDGNVTSKYTKENFVAGTTLHSASNMNKMIKSIKIRKDI
jgi:hypothetical protein